MSKNTEKKRATGLPSFSGQPGGWLLQGHLDSSGKTASFLTLKGRKDGKWLNYIHGVKERTAGSIWAERAANQIVNLSSLDEAGVTRSLNGLQPDSIFIWSTSPS